MAETTTFAPDGASESGNLFHHVTHGSRVAGTERKRDASGVTHENGRRGKIG